MVKTLESMNLIDNFLFGEVMDHIEYGPDTAETILKTILGRDIKIKQLSIEKPIYASDSKYHGIRLDAIVEEDTADLEQKCFYDLEPDNKEKEKKLLPRRSRYYHSIIDGRLLKAGRTYDELPNAWVIFIVPFDPFGKNRMVYTFRTRCIEDPKMEYADGITTLFLYIYGEEGKYTKELQQLLAYFGHSTRENACNSDLLRIHSYLDDIKTDPETRERFMRMEEYIEREVREAVAEAIAEATAEATAEVNRANARADREKERADTEKERADRAEHEICMLREKLSAYEKDGH